jgi:1-acyl-sn-glycerol-3-phosphate acyltransferase
LLTVLQKLTLNLQRQLAFLNMFWFVPLFKLILTVGGRYQAHNLPQIRRKIAKLTAEADGRPILICANHLTMIDSLLIIWFLYDFKSYSRSFRLFPWNVPEVSNFGRNILLRFMCYLGKCIYVERFGSSENRKITLAKLDYVLARGESLCIFPEGGRSRTGRIEPDNAVYGVGHLIERHPQVQVWCLYLRGDHQQSYSFFPKRGDMFHLDVTPLEPKTTATGRRAQKELTLQVVKQLQVMEANYWHDRQRHHRPPAVYPPSAISSADHG